MQVKHQLIIKSIEGDELKSGLGEPEEMEEEGAYWLTMFPRDVVMLISGLVSTCRHCRLQIVEKPGWIMHRWIHAASGAHLCALPDVDPGVPIFMTRAEPED